MLKYERMEKILISACLVGDNVKYNGGNNLTPKLDALLEKYELIPFCPEVEGVYLYLVHQRNVLVIKLSIKIMKMSQINI